MSKFIRVTNINDDSQILIPVSSITKALSMDGGWTYIEFCDCIFCAKESIEQIETQILRDEFVKTIVSSMPAAEYSYEELARFAYGYADAMLKERLK